MGPPQRVRLALARLGVDEGLLPQIQAPEIAPGLAEVPGQLLVRLDVPDTAEEGRAIARRLDLIVRGDQVLLAEPEPLGPVSRALEDAEARSGEAVLLRVLESIPDELAQVAESVNRELELLETGGVPPTTASPKLRDDVNELERQVRSLEQVVTALQERAEPLVGGRGSARLSGVRDHVRGIRPRIDQLRDRLEVAAEPAVAQRASVAAESTEVVEAAAALGERRLQRVTLAHATTAFIGGLAVSFGAMAAAWTAGPVIEQLGFERAQLLGSLAFPIGFVILLVGKGELFTENFFVPVTGVIARRARVAALLELWGSTLLFNLMGVALFAWLASRDGVLGDHARTYMKELAVSKVSPTFWPSFMKAIFAGWLMTVLTWLMLAARGLGPRLFIIYLVGFLISAGEFNHVVISSAEVFMGILLGGPVSLGGWFFRAFLPGLTGNLVGGVLFVTLLGIVQARTLRESEDRLRKAAEVG